MRSNRIGPSTAAALAHALRGNTNLTCLGISRSHCLHLTSYLVIVSLLLGMSGFGAFYQGLGFIRVVINIFTTTTKTLNSYICIDFTLLQSHQTITLDFILELNMTLGRELVIMHTLSSMFARFCGSCLEVVWRFEQKKFSIGSLRVELILTCREVLKCVGPPCVGIGLLFI